MLMKESNGGSVACWHESAARIDSLCCRTATGSHLHPEGQLPICWSPVILSSCAYLCRRAVWVIGHAATLERSPPWKAFMDHTHQQKTHFVVPRRAGELLKMSRQQLQETLTS